MWLIDVKTRKLIHVKDDRSVIERYAILSHTWDEDEVTFTDMADLAKAKRMRGYRKIELTCLQAEKYGLSYAWVDTCCINGDSSAELSEAINSMYKWYYNSTICYAYLSDVKLPPGGVPNFAQFSKEEGTSGLQRYRDQCQAFVAILGRSRWFTRGWTLQELIAPRKVVFYVNSDDSWIETYSKRTKLYARQEDNILMLALADITGIPLQVLDDRDTLLNTAIGARLSWAAYRETTRVEDQAYCLLGILDINMPLLYGEGTRAFVRLQEEVLRTSSDDSLLYWDPYSVRQLNMLLAPDARCFRRCGGLIRGDISPLRTLSILSFEMTNVGLLIRLPLVSHGESRDVYARLMCTRGTSDVALKLRRVSSEGTENSWHHSWSSLATTISHTLMPQTSILTAYEVVRDNSNLGLPNIDCPIFWGVQDIMLVKRAKVQNVCLELSSDLELVETWPKSWWDSRNNELLIERGSMYGYKLPGFAVRERVRGSIAGLKIAAYNSELSVVALPPSRVTDLRSLLHRWSHWRGKYEQLATAAWIQEPNGVPTTTMGLSTQSGTRICAQLYYGAVRGQNMSESVALPSRTYVLRVWAEYDAGRRLDQAEIAADPGLPSSKILERWTIAE